MPNIFKTLRKIMYPKQSSEMFLPMDLYYIICYFICIYFFVIKVLQCIGANLHRKMQVNEHAIAIRANHINWQQRRISIVTYQEYLSPHLLTHHFLKRMFYVLTITKTSSNGKFKLFIEPDFHDCFSTFTNFKIVFYLLLTPCLEVVFQFMNMQSLHGDSEEKVHLTWVQIFQFLIVLLILKNNKNVHFKTVQEKFSIE